MRLEQLELGLPGGNMTIAFHPRLTVVSGLSWRARQGLIQGLFDAMAASETTARLRYTDVVGTSVDVAGGGSDGQPDTGQSPLGDLAMGREKLEELAVVRPADVGLFNGPFVDAHEAWRAHGTATLVSVQERLLGLLARTRNVGPNREPAPAILDDTFVGLGVTDKWDALDLVERLSQRAQLTYLTDDIYVRAWAERRAPAGVLTLLSASEL